MSTVYEMRDSLREVLAYCDELGYELGLVGLLAEDAIEKFEAEETFCTYCGGNDSTPQGHCQDCSRPSEQKAADLIKAALNMVDVKGRYHSEIAMNRLIEAAENYRSK